jgi:hypothetical protein
MEAPLLGDAAAGSFAANRLAESEPGQCLGVSMSQFTNRRFALAAALTLTALTAGAAKADAIFGSSAIFTDRACGVAADVSCITPTHFPGNLAPPQTFGGYGAGLSNSATLAGGTTSSANVSFGADFLPTIGAGTISGPANRAGVTVQAFQSFTYTGAVAIDLALDAQIHFFTSGDIAGTGNFNDQPNDGSLNVSLMLLRVSDITSQVGPGSTGDDISGAVIAFGAGCAGDAIAASSYGTRALGVTPGDHNLTIGMSQTCGGANIVVNPGDSFVIAVGLQAIANRNGFIDATHTVGVQFDEANTFIDGTHQAVAAGFLENALNEGAAVPEPASWALMIGGFGLAGSALRRRRVLPA